MTVDLTHFTPFTAIAGGVLIGLSSALMILLNGRIAGISGTLAGLLRFREKEISVRLAFILGMTGSPLLYRLVTTAPDTTEVTSNTVLLLASGLLVGLGTRYAAGCTSGHGVCGLARRSLRSLIATLTFMAATFVTVFVIRHVL